MKAATMAGKANAFLEFVEARRTHYPLSKDLLVPKERVHEIVGELIKHVPTSFNSQTNRAVILFGAEHEKLWDITSHALKAVIPVGQDWEPTAQKLALFKGAAGTILFFEDQVPVKNLQEKFALYADKFPGWAAQSDGMIQFAVWTALAAEGVHANLQHYNPLIELKVKEAWGVPQDWALNAQLVFGGKITEPGEKKVQSVENTIKVYGM